MPPLNTPLLTTASCIRPQQFTYLGSILSSDSDLTNEIQQRVKLASSAFGRLANHVFFNRNLTVSTKVAVCKAICLSILLCRCESWIPYRRHIKALEAYHVRCLQSILGIRWWHIQKYVRLPKLNPLSSYYYKDNFGVLVTSYVCHPTIFHRGVGSRFSLEGHQFQ